MDPDVVLRISSYAKEKGTLTPDQREETNQILKDLIERCKELGPGQAVGAIGQNPQEFRESIPCSVFEDFAILGDYWLLADDFSTMYPLICNLCRFGRNATVTCRRNQDIIAECGLLLVPVSILEEEAPKMCGRRSESDLVLIRLALQMVCNCMVCNVEVAENLTTQHDIFDTILAIVETFEDEQTRQYAAMTGYTIVDLLGYGTEVNVGIVNRPEVLEIVMGKLDEEPFRLWFSVLMSSDGFLPAIFQETEMDKVLRASMLKTIVKYEFSLTDESVICLRDLFKEMAHTVISVQPAQVAGLITEELAALLDLLTLLCSDHENSRIESLLQNDQLFVGTANRLLNTIHLAGKRANNSLSPLEKIEDVQNAMTDTELACNPTYLFKSNLIRLIGNLAYKHKPNQATTLELETLPIILECTKIDGRNPFAPQCAVFAMRVLLEDNAENQKFVAQMNKISKVYE